MYSFWNYSCLKKQLFCVNLCSGKVASHENPKAQVSAKTLCVVLKSKKLRKKIHSGSLQCNVQIKQWSGWKMTEMNCIILNLICQDWLCLYCVWTHKTNNFLGILILYMCLLTFRPSDFIPTRKIRSFSASVIANDCLFANSFIFSPVNIFTLCIQQRKYNLKWFILTRCLHMRQKIYSSLDSKKYLKKVIFP